MCQEFAGLWMLCNQTPQTTGTITVSNLTPQPVYNFQVLVLNMYGTTSTALSNITTTASTSSLASLRLMATSVTNQSSSVIYNEPLPQTNKESIPHPHKIQPVNNAINLPDQIRLSIPVNYINIRSECLSTSSPNCLVKFGQL
jgi:hypothetical protein